MLLSWGFMLGMGISGQLWIISGGRRTDGSEAQESREQTGI
jgi:hypothetical protein